MDRREAQNMPEDPDLMPEAWAEQQVTPPENFSIINLDVEG